MRNLIIIKQVKLLKNYFFCVTSINAQWMFEKKKAKSKPQEHFITNLTFFFYV